MLVVISLLLKLNFILKVCVFLPPHLNLWHISDLSKFNVINLTRERSDGSLIYGPMIMTNRRIAENYVKQ